MALSGLSDDLQGASAHPAVSAENAIAAGGAGAGAALAEGLDLSAAERLFGFRHATITRWLLRAGAHAQTLQKRSASRNLEIPHLQLDELRTRLRSHTQVLWLWVAIDPLTKCIPVLQLGPRTHQMAQMLIHHLRDQLAPGCLPLFTSDGLTAYFYALTAHFGSWIKKSRSRRNVRQWQVAAGLMYGQVKKSYQQRKLVRVKHVIQLGTPPAFTEALQALGFSGRVNTATISRVNLTIRRGVAALARRTWATALLTPHLQAHVHWWQAYYHFVRPHASLRMALEQPREGDSTVVRPAIDSGHQPWQLAEPVAGGQQGRCSATRCHRSPLEKSRKPEGHGLEMAGAVLHQAETHLLWRKCNLLSSSMKENQPKHGLAEACRIIHHVRELYPDGSEQSTVGSGAYAG